jgi:adenylate kinase family enzyme
MKVAIIGYSGSGKSTLAGRLGSFYNCPVLYLDKIQFEENWKERDVETAKAIVKDFLDSNGSWIIDGNYTKFFRERRLEEADVIIYMNFSRWICLRQVLARYRKYKGKTRESIADGCDEKLDYEFIKWILIDGRLKEKQEQYAETIKKYSEKTIILKNRKETSAFLYNLLAQEKM